jgi:hypothetical protein
MLTVTDRDPLHNAYCHWSVAVLTYRQFVWLRIFTELRFLVHAFTASCPSVCPHGTTRLPMQLGSWNLIITFLKSVERIQVSLKYDVNNTGWFISRSWISDLCGTDAGMFTPKGSMSTEGETLQFSALPYRCSICPTFVTRQMSIL